MLDIFNKNRIKELEEINNAIRNHRDYYEKLYISQVEHTNSLVKDNSYLKEENQKLLNWIENILKVVNTSNISKYDINNTITIPIYKETKPYYIEGDWSDSSCKREDIFIPAIRISQIKSINDLRGE